MQLDATDRAILRLLQQNARLASAAIARAVGLAPSAVSQRIRRLEERGIITGYACSVDAGVLGRGLVAFVRVQTREHSRDEETGAALAALPEALEVHRVVGEDCFIVKVRVRDTAALGDFLDERLGGIPAVGQTRTTMVLRTVKESMQLPLEECLRPEVERC